MYPSVGLPDEITLTCAVNPRPNVLIVRDHADGPQTRELYQMGGIVPIADCPNGGGCGCWYCRQHEASP
jgi:hypothetical protein